MLPFVCKCIPLKERNSEHMAKSTTTIAHLVIGPKTTPSHRNESFSNTDYLPMTYQGDTATVNSSNSGEINDLTTDCYCNTSEPFEVRYLEIKFQLIFI
jgi:hypothetical protein